jgi:hypothetical protein
MPFGCDTVAAIEAKLASDVAIIKQWREISVSTLRRIVADHRCCVSIEAVI